MAWQTIDTHRDEGAARHRCPHAFHVDVRMTLNVMNNGVLDWTRTALTRGADANLCENTAVYHRS